eukprot:8376288-Pyramimonas_sp.AAC.1
MQDLDPAVASLHGRGTCGRHPGVSRILVRSWSPDLRMTISSPMRGFQGTAMTGLMSATNGTADWL